MPGLSEDQDRGGHSRIRLEHAGRHGNHGLQALVIHQLLTEGFVDLAVAKEYTIRNNTCATATQFEHPNKERDKEQLGLLGVGIGKNILVYIAFVKAACKGWVSHDE